MYHDEEEYDSMHYDMDITFSVRVAKWRINDPRKPENHRWILYVYDQVRKEYVQCPQGLDREGEYAYLDDVVIHSSEPALVVPEIPEVRGKNVSPF